MSKKLGYEGKKCPWMNKELLSFLKYKQKTQRRWKQGQTTWEKYREITE